VYAFVHPKAGAVVASVSVASVVRHFQGVSRLTCLTVSAQSAEASTALGSLVSLMEAMRFSPILTNASFTTSNCEAILDVSYVSYIKPPPETHNSGGGALFMNNTRTAGGP